MIMNDEVGMKQLLILKQYHHSSPSSAKVKNE
jgi:hypothetical protein